MAIETETVLNPIAWAQFKLAGGAKRLLALAGIYAAAVVFFNIFIFRTMNNGGGFNRVLLSAFASSSLTLTLFISAIIIVLVGCGAINKAILRDFTSDMITSHRCSAMTGRVAVLGYLTGPTLSVFCLTAVNWLACTLLAGLAGVPWYAPSFLFAVIACLAMVTWTAAVLSALSYRGKVSFATVLTPVVILVTAGPLSEALFAHPGLALLLNIGVVKQLGNVAAAGVTPELATSVVIAMLFQIMLAMTFFLAAARRYQRDDVPAFTPTLAYCLLALCSLICAVGINRAGNSQNPPRMSMLPDELAQVSTQVLVSFVTIALAAMLPVANAAWNSMVRSRRKLKDPAFSGPRARPAWEAAVGAAIVGIGVFAATARDAIQATLEEGTMPPGNAAAYATGAFFLSLLAIGGLLRFVYTFSSNAIWILILFFVVFWVGPLIADLMLEVADERAVGEPKSWVFAVSPIGVWMMVFKHTNGSVTAGMAVQVGIAALMQILPARERS